MIKTDKFTIYNDDCFKILKDIPDNSIDLLLFDPPYNISKDKSWDKFDNVNAYIEFMGRIFTECERILKDNGSMYFWHNEFLQIVELQNYIKQNTDFVFRNILFWIKPNYRRFVWHDPSDKNTSRNYFNINEYCLYYIKNNKSMLYNEIKDEDYKSKTDNFAPLRLYFDKVINYIRINKTTLIKANGGLISHCFNTNGIQWSLPTEEGYNLLINKYNIDKMEGFISYIELKDTYITLRYKHNLSANHNNIFIKDPDYSPNRMHPCNKEIDILKKIIYTSSNEGDIVLDMFMGAGSCGVASLELNRKFIGIEIDKKYYDFAYEKLKNV